MAEQIDVLHVDDDPTFTDLTATFLTRDDDQFVVETASSASEALAMIDDRPPDCIVSDYNMPGMDGLAFAEAVHEAHPELPFILFTGKGSEEVASEAISAGVTDYLQKGSGSDRYELLANRIRNAVRARRETRRAERQTKLMRLTEFAGGTGGFEIRVETETVLLTDGASRVTGISARSDLELAEVIDRYHPEDRDDLRRDIDRACRTGERVRGTYRYRRDDGEQRSLEVTLSPAASDGEDAVLRGVINDVTEKRDRKRELRSERQFTRQALDALEDMVYVVDKQGRLRRWNEQVSAVTGRADAELDGIRVTELFPEDERGRIADTVETTIADGRTTIEAEMWDADGQRVPYEFKATKLLDEAGPTARLIGVGRDLTDRRQRERRFEAVVEGSNDIISIVDSEGRFQYQSPSIERVLGHDPAETVGDVAWRYVHPDDREDVVNTFETWVAAPSETDTIEYRARDADGDWRWMEANGNDRFDDPAVNGYVVSSREITGRKERERRILELNQQYQALVESIPDGAVFLFDRDLEYVRARGPELDAVDISSDELEGATPRDVFPAELADEIVRYYASTLDGERQTFEQSFDGKRYRIQTAPVRSDDGEVTHGMALSQNVTDQAERRRKLERQNERLDEFVDVVSHDLRNPLSVASGYVELVRDEYESDELETVADAIDRSQALIDDMLTLAREGKRVGEIESVDLGAVAEDCWQTVETKRATLDVDAARVVDADPRRLRQLFENLYRNAVEHGGDDVAVCVETTPDGFAVTDTGPGIPEADRATVFEAGHSTERDGTGYGLRIVEQVVEAHGWEIRVAEGDRGGARFEIGGLW